MKRVSLFFATILCLAALSAGCAPAVADPTPTPTVEAIAETPSPTPEPTLEPIPTSTPAPTPMPVDVPIVIDNVIMDKNSIGTPQVSLIVHNRSDTLTVDAFEIKGYCFNNFEDQIKGYGVYEYFTSVFQEEEIGPSETYNNPDLVAMLYGFDDATNVIVAITRVHTTDGQTIEVPEDRLIFIYGELD